MRQLLVLLLIYSIFSDPVLCLESAVVNVGFAFWGITRSLTSNYPAIKEHIMAPINRIPGVRSYRIIHTYKVRSRYTNPRAGETNLLLNNSEYQLLDADFVMIEDQNLVRRKIGLERYHSHPDAWNTPNHSSTDFMILAMWSKLQLVRMIKDSGIDFKYVVFIRPDTTFKSSLDVSDLKLVDDGSSVCVPEHDRWGGGKVGSFNDKFAITSGSTFLAYGSIFHDLLNMSKKRSLHSESVYSDYLGSRGIKVCSTTVLPIKVRAPMTLRQGL